jgi:hypothetical protein
MGTTKRAIFLTALILGTVMALSACGTTAGLGDGAGTPSATAARPDRLHIAIDEPIAPPPGGTQPVVTLNDAALVQQLYATILALSPLPAQRACTDERGPHYTLTFLQGTATLVTVQANRDGCWPVTIAGEPTPREATTDFWQQLDQAIVTATPPLSPDRLAIATSPQASQAPQSTLITSATTVQQLYDAILALPRTNAAPSCSAEPAPTDQLVFFVGEQAVPASVYEGCQAVEVDGGHQWRGGTFAMNDQFRSMLQAVLDGATFAPAQPDHLAVAVEHGQTTSYQENFSDRQVMLALYDQIFRLPETAAQSGCPSNADKLAGSGTFTTLTFSQWDLPLVRIDTYQGSCSYVQLSDTGQRLQGNQTFWDLINRALAP